MDDKHICDKEVVLRRALDVADAVEWRGDTTVNFMTALRSARVLAEEVRRLRANELLLAKLTEYYAQVTQQQQTFEEIDKRIGGT